MVEVRAEAYVRRLTGVNRICLLSSSAGTWVHKRVVGSERRGSGWIVSNPETDPPPTRRIVSPPPIYATVSGTHGSNSGIPYQRFGAFAGTVLSQLRARGGRSPHLRRLLGRNLPGLRHAARSPAYKVRKGRTLMRTASIVQPTYSWKIVDPENALKPFRSR